MVQGRNKFISTKIKHNLTHSTHLTNAGNITVALMSAVIAANVATPASANPNGEVVKHGDVSFDRPSGTKLNVNQSSDKAIIEWNDFSIGKFEHTKFNQPNAGSVTLNRVVGDNLSNIQGKLTSNGTVILVNPNSIVFGKTSVVNVGSLIATTADITDENFINGNYDFSVKAPDGSSVTNKSFLMSVKDGGVAAFVAPNVRNDGVIIANAAKISLAGGDSFTVDLYGDGLVNLEVQSEVKENAGTVINNGQIINPQGRVALTTAEAQTLVNGMVNMGSIKQASTAHIIGDSIILDAGNSGTVEVAGKLNATGLANLRGDGGSITVKGGKVDIKDTAELDASGSFSGNGGSVLVKSENTSATMNGAIDVRAGIWGGDAGVAEVGGKEFYLAGTIQGGEGGTIIIDPTELYIGDGNGGISPAANTVYEEWIEAQSASGTNIVLTASELIQLQDLTDNELTGGKGSISLLANEGGSTIGAINFIDLNDAITTTEGNITLEAGAGGIAIGDLRIESGASVPGLLRISTVNNGNVSAQNLRVDGYQNASAEINADGAVNVNKLEVLAKGIDTDVTATAVVSSANSGVDLATLTVDSMVQESNSSTISQSASASATVTAAEDVNLSGTTTVSAFTKAMETKMGDALYDAEAYADLNVNADQDVVTHDVTVRADVVASGDIYKSATAIVNTAINGANTVTTTGDTFVSALAYMISGLTSSLSDVRADAKLDISAENDIATNGAITVNSGANALSLYAHNVDSSAIANLVSENGNIEVNGPVQINSDSIGYGAVPIDVVVEFLKHNADYDSSFGTYNWDTKTGEIRWADLSTTTEGDSFTMRVADLESNGFFLIPNGAGRNTTVDGGGATVPAYSDNDTVTFQLNGSGKWAAHINGQPLLGSGGSPAYFSSVVGATGVRNDVTDGVLNPDGVDHAIDTTMSAGNSNWEDKYNGTIGAEYKGDDNFNITYTEGQKASASSTSALTVNAKNGNVVVNGDVDSNALLNIMGNGYNSAETDADITFNAGENLTVNGDVAVLSQTLSNTNVDSVIANADILMVAAGKTGTGNVAINGDLSAIARTSNTDDVTLATIRADAADNIVFDDAIADPVASTETILGSSSQVQGRVTMQDAVDNDESRLIFNALQDPHNPGGNPPGGNPPGGNPPGGNPPGGNPPGGEPNEPGTPGTPGNTIGSNTLNPIFIDPLQRFLISLRDAGLFEFVGERPYSLSLSQIKLSLLSSGTGGDTSNLSPEQLGSLAPAAGGMTTGGTTVNCANSYLDSGYGADTDIASCSDNNQSVN